MIYEGCLIQRLVTPHWPGDPELTAAGAPEFRTEYVKAVDAEGNPTAWTLMREEGFHFPTHLEAARRAKLISPHCHASVVGGNRNANPNFTILPVEGSSSARAAEQLPGLGVLRHEVSGGIQSTSTRKARAAGKAISKQQGGAAVARSPRRQVANSNPTPAIKRKSSRLEALRQAAERTAAPHGRFWWQEGQFA